MNLIEILQRFQPVRESFVKFAGLWIGVVPLRETCRAAATLFEKPRRQSANNAYQIAGLRGNVRMLEIALEHGANDHINLLYWSAYGGNREFCKYAMERIAKSRVVGQVYNLTACPLLTGIEMHDIMFAGAADGGQSVICDWAMQLGSINYNAMAFLAASSGHREILARSVALGADIKFAIYGAAYGRRAAILRELYELGGANPHIVTDHALMRKVDYDKQKNRCDLIDTLRAIRHDKDSITYQHLKRFKSAHDECCIELFRLACANGCNCANVCCGPYQSCFATDVNCREIWQVALDYGKITRRELLIFEASRGSPALCEFALEKWTEISADIEEILEIGAKYGSIRTCEFARGKGAIRFSSMFSCAAVHNHMELCRVAIEWSELAGSRVDVERMLNAGALNNRIELCRAALKFGAVCTDFALEESIAYGYRDIAALIMNMDIDAKK